MEYRKFEIKEKNYKCTTVQFDRRIIESIS